ncbi:MAG TPA: pitrilysin family protein [Candidatus Angelobacter sp.]|nr:pitrilysin family protein [Candidatus Angelobacter sp.]
MFGRVSVFGIFLTLLMSLASLGSAEIRQGATESEAREPKTQEAAGHKIAVPPIPFEKYKLKNGLEVILSEDHNLPLVAVYVMYHVGPANERPGRTGFAHLFEHLMFEGSLHTGSKVHFKTLEALGAKQINGTTDLDHTKYFETVPSNELEKALWLESDRMGFLLETIDNTELANQRDVVRNERRQKIENEPYGLADEGVFHLLFPKEHPYHADTIGSHADIEAARIADVREFFRLYYAPNNASLAIVGDIDKTQAKHLVEKYFGPLPAGDPVPKIAVVTPPITVERRAIIADRIELPRVYIAWITDPSFRPGDAEEQLLGDILGGPGKSSRLYKKLVYEKQLAQDVSAQQTSLSLGSVFTIQVTARPGIKPEQLESAIDDELAEMRRSGPTQAELDRARNLVEARILRRMESLGGEGGVAGRLSRYNHYLGDPGFLPKDLERYEKVSLRGVQLASQQKLTKDSRVVVYCVPGSKVVDDVPKSTGEGEAKAEPPTPDRAAFLAAQAWRSRAPLAGSPRKVNLPIPKQFKLDNGLSVLLVERHNLPVVTANLFLLSGSDANPPDKPGLAAFTAKMLEEGTGKRSALQIAQDADGIGAELSTSSTNDWTGVFIRCLKQNLDPGFDLLGDLVLNPAFAAADLERLRKERLVSLAQQRDNAVSLALKELYQATYGGQHPYGYIELGTEDSLKKITSEDLKGFWAAGYVPTNAVLAIAGDVTEAETRTLAAKYFGSWQGPAHKSQVPQLPLAVSSHIVIIDKPGSPQTALAIGTAGVSRSSPDYAPVEVMNTILGGQVSSRLNANLREKHGYTYAAFSQFVYRRGPGPFFARSSVRTDVTAPAIGEIFSELNALRNVPVPAGELQSTKESMGRALPGLFETTQQTARSIADLYVYGLPLDYFNRLPAQIEAVSSKALQEMAEKYLQPSAMIVVAVGDRKKIEPEIRKLNLAPIEIRDLDGNLQGK